MATNTNTINGDLYILNDASNSMNSRSANINPSTTLDQVYDQNNIDNTTAKYKTLRKILDEFEQLIKQGGDIVFPVTSVNGKSGFVGDRKSDVIITKEDIGLDNVENLPNDDRPLGKLAREDVLILIHDLVDDLVTEIDRHVKDMNNPHKVNLNTINIDGSLTRLIADMIDKHLNNDSDPIGHIILNQLISQLKDKINDGTTGNSALYNRITTVNNSITAHTTDSNAHANIFIGKENISFKVNTIDPKTVSGTDGKYPTVYAVVEYINDALKVLDNPIDITKQVVVVGNGYKVTSLPTASKDEYDKHIIYILPNGRTGGRMEMATLISQTSGSSTTYVWDYTLIGPYSTYDSDYFVYDANKGLTIDLVKLMDDVYNNSAVLNDVISNIVKSLIGGYLNNYYTKSEIDAKGYISKLNIASGSSDGTIRVSYETADSKGVMIAQDFDVKVTGLKALAFQDEVQSAHIADGAVINSKIGTYEITGDKIQDTTITADKISLPYNHMLANMFDENNNRVEPINVYWFADFVINRFLEYIEFAAIDDQTIIEDVTRIFEKIIGSDDPNTLITFYLDEDLNLFMFFPGIYDYDRDPDIRIEGDDINLYIDDDDENLTLIEKILLKYEFYVRDGDLWLSTPLSYAMLR